MVWAVAAAAFMSAASQVQQGRAEGKAAEANARTDLYNARLAKQKGRDRARQVRREGRQHLGRIRSQTGASGIQVSGSALDVMAADAFQIEMDAQITKYNADIDARSFRQQADRTIREGSQRKTAAFIGAGTQLLSAGTTIAAGS